MLEVDVCERSDGAEDGGVVDDESYGPDRCLDGVGELGDTFSVDDVDGVGKDGGGPSPADAFGG
jgi:hypothetical protein|tara:strand:- start:98 stop:289 length:192 start_codon:yes stop_codon:yes gene_type:complete